MTVKSQIRRKGRLLLRAFEATVLATLELEPASLGIIVDWYVLAGYKGARDHLKALLSRIEMGYQAPELYEWAAQWRDNRLLSSGIDKYKKVERLRTAKRKILTGYCVLDSHQILANADSVALYGDGYLGPLPTYSYLLALDRFMIYFKQFVKEKKVAVFPDMAKLALLKDVNVQLSKRYVTMRSRRCFKVWRNRKANMGHDVQLVDASPNLIFPTIGTVVNLDRLFDELQFALCIPYVNPLTSRVSTDGWSVSEVGDRMVFVLNDSPVYTINSRLYFRYVYQRNDGIVVSFAHQYCFISKSFSESAPDVHFVVMAEKNLCLAVPVDVFVAARLAAVNSTLDLNEVQRAIVDVVPDIIPENLTALALATLYTVQREFMDELPIDRSEYTWLDALLFPVTLAGKFIQGFAGTIASILLSKLKKVTGKPVAISLDVPATRPASRQDGLWYLEESVDLGVPNLSGEALDLVKKIEMVNGFRHQLPRLAVKFTDLSLSYTEHHEERDKVLEHIDPVPIINEVVAATDAQFISLHPDWHEFQINTSPLPLNFPQALKIRALDGVTQTYQLSRVHLPVTHVREMPRKTDYVSALRALSVRNLAVSHQNYEIDPDAYYEEHFPGFIKTFLVDDTEEKARYFQANPPDVDFKPISRFVAAMSPSKRAKYLRADVQELDAVDYTDFSAIIKKAVKPQVVHTKIGSPQTIVHYEPERGASNQPLWDEVKRRWVELHKPNIFFTDGLDDIDIEKRIELFKPAGLKRRSVQRDLSAYDKSIGRVPMRIFRRICEFLGMPKTFLDLWFNSADRVTARFIALYMKMEIALQQRSGVGPTLFLNGVVNEFSEYVAGKYEPLDFRYMWFQGDDVEVCVEDHYEVPENTSQFSADLFNLTEKRYVYEHASYCCSRFVIPVRGRQRLVYDPFKMLAKFGTGLTTFEYDKLNERYVSYIKLIGNYEDPEVRTGLILAASEMYGFPNDLIAAAILACRAALSSERRFISMWHREPVLR